MADFTADFEAGVNGATITTGGGEASATAWDAVNGTPSYDNTHAAHGTLAGKFGTNGDYLRWTTGANPTDHYGRIYLYATANPAGDDAVLNVSGSGAGGVATIKVKTDGKLRVETYQGGTGADSTGSIALNQWIRLEYHVVHNGTTGTIECKYFSDASSTSATETIITPAGNTGASCDSIQFQRIVYGSDIWIDDLIANATSYPGPVAAAPQTLLPATDSVDGAWTDQAGGTSLVAAIDEATFDDADYIRSDLNPSASGCRIKLTAGGDPHVSNDHIIHWRTGKIGSATINMTVKLYQGGGNSQGAGTLIASFARNNVGSLTTYDETLSSGEADSITDYTDLYLEFFANTV